MILSLGVIYLTTEENSGFAYIFIQDNEALDEHGHDEHAEENENHAEEESHEGHEHEGHVHGDVDDDDDEHDMMAFKMIEVITGLKDDGYTEIHLIDSLPENTKVVMNVAYYLLSDLKKDEVGDDD